MAQPKRAKSAYAIFAGEKRSDVKRGMRALDPEVNNQAVEEELKKRFASLSGPERQVYEAKAAADRKRYETDMRRFKEKSQELEREANKSLASKKSKKEEPVGGLLIPKKPLIADDEDCGSSAAPGSPVRSLGIPKKQKVGSPSRGSDEVTKEIPPPPPPPPLLPSPTAPNMPPMVP